MHITQNIKSYKTKQDYKNKMLAVIDSTFEYFLQFLDPQFLMIQIILLYYNKNYIMLMDRQEERSRFKSSKTRQSNISRLIQFSYDPNQLLSNFPKSNLPLHEQHPVLFKDKVRLNLLPNYDYNLVLRSLIETQHRREAKIWAYSLSYAQKNGHFKLRQTMESVTKYPEAQAPFKDIIQKNSENEEEQVEEDQLSYIQNHHSKYGKLEIVMDKQVTVNTDYDEDTQRTQTKLKLMQTVVQQNYEMKQERQQNDTKAEGFQGDYAFFRTKFHIFEDYQSKSRNQPIKQNVINKDIYEIFNSGRYVSKLTLFRKANSLSFDIFTSHKNSKICNTNDFCLKVLCFQIVYNNVVLHKMEISDEFQYLLLSFMKISSQNWLNEVFKRSKSELIYFKDELEYFTSRHYYKECGIKQFAQQLISKGKLMSWLFYKNQLTIQQNDIDNTLNCLLKSLRIKCAKIVAFKFNKLLKLTKQQVSKLNKLEQDPQKQVRQIFSEVLLNKMEGTLNDNIFNQCFQDSLILSNKNYNKSKRVVLSNIKRQETRKKFFPISKIAKNLIEIQHGNQLFKKDDQQKHFRQILADYVSYFIQYQIVPDKIVHDIIILCISSTQKQYFQRFLFQIIKCSTKFVSLKTLYQQKDRNIQSMILKIVAAYQLILKQYPKDEQIYQYLKPHEIFEYLQSNTEIRADITNGIQYPLVTDTTTDKIKICALTAQFLQLSKIFIPTQVLQFCINNYARLDIQARFHIVHVFTANIGYFLTNQGSTQKILKIIKEENNLAALVDLKLFFVQLYCQMITVNKQKYYESLLSMFEFHKAKQDTQENKVKMLNTKILYLMKNEQNDSEGFEFQILTKILSFDAYESYIESAIEIGLRKLQGGCAPISSFVWLLQRKVLKMLEDDSTNKKFMLIEKIFGLNVIISNDFLENCLTCKKNKNQIIQIMFKSSLQQLDSRLFSLVLQNKIAQSRLCSANLAHLFQKLELTYLNSEFVNICLRKLPENQNLIILERIENIKDSELYNIAEAHIMQKFTISMRPEYIDYLSRKLQIMGELRKDFQDRIMSIPNSSLLTEKLSKQMLHIISLLILKNSPTHYETHKFFDFIYEFVEQSETSIYVQALNTLIKCQKSRYKFRYDEVKVYTYFQRLFQNKSIETAIRSLDLSQSLYNICPFEDYEKLLNDLAKKYPDNAEIITKIDDIIKNQTQNQYNTLSIQNENTSKGIISNKWNKIKSLVSNISSRYSSKLGKISKLQYSQQNIIDLQYQQELYSIATDSQEKINHALTVIYQVSNTCKLIILTQIIKCLFKNKVTLECHMHFITVSFKLLQSIKQDITLFQLYEKYLLNFTIDDFGQPILNSIAEVNSTLKSLVEFIKTQNINCLLQIIDTISFNLKSNTSFYRKHLLGIQKKILQQLQQVSDQTVQRSLFVLSNVFDYDIQNQIYFTSLINLLLRTDTNKLSSKWIRWTSISLRKINKQELIKNANKLTHKLINQDSQEIVCEGLNLLIGVMQANKNTEIDFHILDRLEQFSQSKSTSLAKQSWKCIFKVCEIHPQYSYRFSYAIRQIQQKVTSKNIQITPLSLYLMSHCDFFDLPSATTVTEILLLNLYYCCYINSPKFDQNKNYQTALEYEQKRNFRQASQFLIIKERLGIDLIKKSNANFLYTLQNLVYKYKLSVLDVTAILKFSKKQFRQCFRLIEQIGIKYIELQMIEQVYWKTMAVPSTITCLFDLLKIGKFYQAVQAITTADQIKLLLELIQIVKKQSKIQNINFSASSYNGLITSIIIQLLTEKGLKLERQLYDSIEIFIEKAINDKAPIQKIYQILKQTIQKEFQAEITDRLTTISDYFTKFEVQHIDLMRSNCIQINKKFLKMNGITQEKSSKQILEDLWRDNGPDIKQFSNELTYILNESDQLKNQIFKQGMEGIYLAIKKFNDILYKVENKKLRKTQLISIWIAVRNLQIGKQSNILQISTGEGKSIIVAGIAYVLASLSYNVDVATSSPVLAQRDERDLKQLFKALNITCGHSIDSSGAPYISGEKQAYKKQIVFSTCIQLCFDWLRHHHLRLNTKGNRDLKRTILIVDEADNSMIDNMFYVARLADSFSGAESLLPLYFNIWNTYEQLLARLIERQGKLYQVKGFVRQENGKIILQYQQNLGDEQPAKIQDLEQYIDQAIDNGKDLSELPFVQNVIECDSPMTYIKLKMESFIQNIINLQKNNFVWSNTAREFAKSNIHMWVDSLLSATALQQNCNYIVTKTKLIKPVDFKNTGLVQSNTSLSYGIHQFLQCKHSCPLSLQTRTTNYLSFYSFFEQYRNNIIGVTGTIGGRSSQSIFHEAYNCRLIKIPKYMKDKSRKLNTVAKQDENSWLNEIVRRSILEARKRRAVLIICETIGVGKKLYSQLSKKYQKHRITVYLSSESKHEGGDSEVKRCQQGEIIISTNLAGRGTDISTSQIEKSGGLHVILTYLPDSQRVQMQAFGRTARNGKLGSYQLIINRDDQIEIQGGDQSYEESRNSREADDSKQLFENLKIIKIQSKIFNQYNDWLIKVRQQLDRVQIDYWIPMKKSLKQIVLLQIEDRFSNIINETDKIMSNLEKKTQVDYDKIQKKMEGMLSCVKKSYQNDSKYLSSLIGDIDKFSGRDITEKCFIRNGCYYLKLVNEIISSNVIQKFEKYESLASKLIDAAQIMNPNDFNAYYLKAYLLIRGKFCWMTRNDHGFQYKKEALNNMKKAKLLLQNQIAGYESVTISLSTKRMENSKIYQQFFTKAEVCYECYASIDRIISTLESINKNDKDTKEKDVDISDKMTKIQSLYTKSNCPYEEIIQLKNRGFELIFDIKERKPIPIGAICALAGIAAAQIIGGTLLILTGAGATVGAALIAESLNEVFEIFNVVRTGEFHLKQYLISKGISLALTAVTLGWSQIKAAGKGVNMVFKTAVAEVKEIGLKTVIKKAFKQLATNQSKQLFALVGKKLLVEGAQQITSRAASSVLSCASQAIIERLQFVVEQKVQNTIQKNHSFQRKLRSWKIIEIECTHIKIQKGRSELSLKQEVSCALNPVDRSNPQVKQILAGLKNIASKLFANVSKSNQGIQFLQTALGALSMLTQKLDESAQQMIGLIDKHLSLLPYPTNAIKQLAGSCNSLDPDIVVKSFTVINEKRSNIKNQIEKVNQSNAIQIINTAVQQLVGTSYDFTKQINYSDCSENPKSCIHHQFVQHLENRSEEFNDNLLGMVHKEMVSFMMAQLKKNVQTRVVSKISPFIAGALSKFVKQKVEKAVVSVGDHHNQDKLLYERLKNSKDRTKEDDEFIELFENPRIDEQLMCHGRNNASELKNLYIEMVIEGKIAANQNRNIQLVNGEVQNLYANDCINGLQMKIMCKKLGLKVRQTKDPNDSLTEQEKRDGVQLVLFESGGFDQKGATIGHFKMFSSEKGKFISVNQQGQQTCGLDVIRCIAKQQGIHVNKTDLKNVCADYMQQNSSEYAECLETHKFLEVQYPKHMNSLIMTGGFDKEKDTQIRAIYYNKGVHYDYNDQIYHNEEPVTDENGKIRTDAKGKIIWKKGSGRSVHEFVANKYFTKDANGNYILKPGADIEEMNKLGLLKFPSSCKSATEKKLFLQKQMNNTSKLIQMEKQQHIAISNAQAQLRQKIQKISQLQQQIINLGKQNKLQKAQRKHNQLIQLKKQAKNKYDQIQRSPQQFYAKNKQYGKISSQTYNTVCRHQTTGLKYLYEHDQKFKGILEQGDVVQLAGTASVNKIPNVGHLRMEVNDVRTGKYYTVDPTNRRYENEKPVQKQQNIHKYAKKKQHLFDFGMQQQPKWFYAQQYSNGELK